jgi:hypothetical protein
MNVFFRSGIGGKNRKHNFTIFLTGNRAYHKNIFLVDEGLPPVNVDHHDLLTRL